MATSEVIYEDAAHRVTRYYSSAGYRDETVWFHPPPAEVTFDELAVTVGAHTTELAQIDSALDQHAASINRALVTAPVFRFRAKAPSVSGDPGPGFVRYNQVAQTTSTVLAIDIKDQDALDVTIGLSVFRVDDKVYLQDFEDAANYQSWRVLGPGVNKTGWWEFPVTIVASAGTGATNFVNGQMLAMRVTPSGPPIEGL